MSLKNVFKLSNLSRNYLQRFYVSSQVNFFHNKKAENLIIRTLSASSRHQKSQERLNQQRFKRVQEERRRQKNLVARKKFPVIETQLHVTLKEISDLTGRHIDLVKQAVVEVMRIEAGKTYKIEDQTSINAVIKKLGFRRKLSSNKSDDEVENLLQQLQDLFPLSGIDEKRLETRVPIVTMLGHIDHGKTSLLDQLRKSSVASKEEGGITQKIGAFLWESPNKTHVTFVDAPGHAAFTNIRRRGAGLTDVVVLVVAADDGVMEQTIESLKMIREARVPVVVAINKCDLPHADPKLALMSLAEEGLVAESLGGEIQTQNISAKTGQGINQLMEKVMMEAEMAELRSDRHANVAGVVLESRVDPHFGHMATVIIKQGTIRPGQFVVCGESWAKVKVLFDESRRRHKEIALGRPVHVAGWKLAVEAGEELHQVANEMTAKKLVEVRRKLKDFELNEKRSEEEGVERDKYRSIYEDIRKRDANKFKKRLQLFDLTKKSVEVQSENNFNILIKADEDGPLEALMSVLRSFNCKDQVNLNVVSSSFGSISVGDVEHAAVTEASIYSFNVQPKKEVIKAAEERKVKIYHFAVIYHLVAHLRESMSQTLPMVTKMQEEGEAVVKELFYFKHKTDSKLFLGSEVVCGRVDNGANFQLLRDDDVIDEGEMKSLQQGKTRVDYVTAGKEFGVELALADDVIPKVGDVIKFGQLTEEQMKLAWTPRGF